MKTTRQQTNRKNDGLTRLCSLKSFLTNYYSVLTSDMMSNWSTKWRNVLGKYSKFTNEDESVELDIVTISGSLPLTTYGPCFLCPTISNHKAEVNKIVEIGNRAKLETDLRVSL